MERARDAIQSRASGDTDVDRLLFAPLKEIERQPGLIDQPLQMLRGFPSDMAERAREVTTFHRERAHLIHVLCSYWEDVLEAGKVGR